MSDFLNDAKKLPVEVIEVAGHKVTVIGLGIGELSKLTTGKEKDSAGMTKDLLVACCFTHSGKPLIAEDRKDELDDISPAAFKALSEAVARVNGVSMGNSSATGGEDSSSA